MIRTLMGNRRLGYLVGGLVAVWMVDRLLSPVVPVTASLLTLAGVVVAARAATRYDARTMPGPSRQQVRTAETGLVVGALLAAVMVPTGWSIAHALGAAVVTGTVVAAVNVLGRRHLAWHPNASRLGRLIDANGRVSQAARWTFLLAGAVLAAFLTASGVPVAVLLGLAVAFAPSRSYWATAARDGETRLAVDRALAGVMTGGAWTPLLQEAQRIPVQRLDLNADGDPELLLLPLPEKAGKEQQAKISDEIEDRLASWGSYAVHWDTGARRRITIRRVQPLPTSIPHDGRAATGPDGRRIWLGLGRVNREMVAADPTLTVGDSIDVHLDFASTPHALFVGGTGAGKSFAIQNVIGQWLRNPRNRLLVLDPKRVGFTRLRGKRGVLTVATDFAAMAAAIGAARDEMAARYTRLEAEHLDNVLDLPEGERPPLLLIVIDEATEAVAQDKGIAKDDEEGQAINRAKAEIASAMSSIARLGRAAGIHLLVGTQRADASDGLSGQMKAQLEARLLLGVADSTARMMAGFASSEIQATAGFKGRGIYGRVNTAPVELQMPFTPVTVFDELPDAGAPAPVDANGDGVITTVEAYDAADSDAARVEVLRAAVDAGTLTDDVAVACGYRDTAHVVGMLTDLDQRLAGWKRDADAEVALGQVEAAADRRSQRRNTGTRRPPNVEPCFTDPSAVPPPVEQPRDDNQFPHGGERIEPLPEGEAMAALDRLIGLTETKAEVRALAASVRMEIARAEHGIGNGMVDPGHLIFRGPPGVAKTTTARIIGSLYRDLGVLSSGHVIEVDRAGLVAGYVGQTAGRVASAFEAARGGVLFGDEAYALSSGEFGKEAVEAILKRAEDLRGEVVVILAGYPEQMDGFLDANPGLRSRFPKRVNFPAYDVEELCQIFEVMAEGRHRVLDQAASTALPALMEAQDRDSRDWGNGRSVRNLLDEAMRRQDARLVAAGEWTKADLVTLTAEDILGSKASAEDVSQPEPSKPVIEPEVFTDVDIAPVHPAGDQSADDWLQSLMA